ncbi:MAG: hypothetical protein AAF847_07890 [Bacteroidota bacterium]
MANLSYSKFKSLKQVATQFGLKLKGVDLFEEVEAIVPSDYLLRNIEVAHKLRYGSEKERSERLVAPILAELSRMNDYDLTIYAGRELNVNPERGLNGECDYLLSFGKIMEIIEAPIFTAVEAKKMTKIMGQRSVLLNWWVFKNTISKKDLIFQACMAVQLQVRIGSLCA